MAFSSWQRRAKRNSKAPRSPKSQPQVESLETRDLPSAGFAQPTYILHGDGGNASPQGSPGPTGYTPAQIKHAYGTDQITFTGGVKGDGSGTTIAIVDAFDDPRIANDLIKFDAAFGLPDPVFKKLNQNGQTGPLPASNHGWASEIALDVEWAHAIAPKANIVLVEANDNSFTNLFAAVSTAASQSGVVAVSMSWSGGEFSGETSFDSTFLHTGVTFLASSGDSGAPPGYPAISPNVVSVGGTTLNLDSNGNYISETGWSGSGGGISAFESQPAYQKGVVKQSTTKRTNPDVSYDSDPNTGFPVYDTFNNSPSAPWSQFGGTSDAAPQWAALIAIADQGRAINGLSSLDGAAQTLPMLYSMPYSNFHDITSGTSTGSPHYSAGVGYDLVTGLGTPFANLVVANLAGQATKTQHFSISGPTSTAAGSPFSITVQVLDNNNSPVTNYTGTIHFTSTDPNATLPHDYTFTTGSGGDNGVHTFAGVILDTAGTQTITATDKANSATTGSINVPVTPAAPSKVVFGQQPTDTSVGGIITPAVTVQLLDSFNNLVTTDNTDTVSLALGANPGGGTLSGNTPVTVSGGIATFNNLSINQPGTGYTLVATSGSLPSVTSNTFNIANATIVEDFESGLGLYQLHGTTMTAQTAAVAAHDGNFGLDDTNGSDWIFRTDAAAQVKAGDTLSVWLKFASVADGKANFGFGASASGTLSLLASAKFSELTLQNNTNYGGTNLAFVSQTYLPDHWYRMEVDWGMSGKIIGKLFDSDGVTLLNSVTATTTVITAGGIAFRGQGHDKYWDTVTVQHGVNPFALPGPIGGVPPADLVAAFGRSTFGVLPPVNSGGIVVNPPIQVALPTPPVSKVGGPTGTPNARMHGPSLPPPVLAEFGSDAWVRAWLGRQESDI
jgi:hypothetical protein